VEEWLFTQQVRYYYATQWMDGYPVDIGRTWTKVEIMTAAERRPYKLLLARNVIEMIHSEVQRKVRDGFVEVFYLDKIEDFLGTS